MIIKTLTMAGGSGFIGKDFCGKFEQFDIASGTSPNFEELGENIWKVLINREDKVIGNLCFFIEKYIIDILKFEIINNNANSHFIFLLCVSYKREKTNIILQLGQGVWPKLISFSFLWTFP